MAKKYGQFKREAAECISESVSSVEIEKIAVKFVNELDRTITKSGRPLSVGELSKLTRVAFKGAFEQIGKQIVGIPDEHEMRYSCQVTSRKSGILSGSIIYKPDRGAGFVELRLGDGFLASVPYDEVQRKYFILALKGFIVHESIHLMQWKLSAGMNSKGTKPIYKGVYMSPDTPKAERDTTLYLSLPYEISAHAAESVTTILNANEDFEAEKFLRNIQRREIIEMLAAMESNFGAYWGFFGQYASTSKPAKKVWVRFIKEFTFQMKQRVRKDDR